MEYFENTVANNAGIAQRAIKRLLEAIKEEESQREKIDQSNTNEVFAAITKIAQLEEVLDILTLLHSANDDPLEKELRPKGWLEAANSDGFLFDEYQEYKNLG